MAPSSARPSTGTSPPGAASAGGASTGSVPPADSPASTGDRRAAAQRKIAAVSAALRDAKSRGHDVSALEDRAALALQAFLDGRYDDVSRELDSISARIPR